MKIFRKIFSHNPPSFIRAMYFHYNVYENYFSKINILKNGRDYVKT